VLVTPRLRLIDRIDFARDLCRGRRVLDIGGARMNPGGASHFDNRYRSIGAAAASYVIADRHESADIQVDLDAPGSIDRLHSALPIDVILCMETLEHLRNPGRVCAFIANFVERTGGEAFVTIPRSSWFVRALESRRWKTSHLYSFHDYHAGVFMNLNFNCVLSRWFKCISLHHPAWRLVYAATGFRGLSYGFHITDGK